MKKKINFSKISIRQILIFSYMTILFIPLIVQIFLNSYLINTYKKELSRTDSYLLNDYQITIESYLEDIMNMSSMIYGDDEFIQILKNTDERSQIESYKDHLSFQSYFQQLLYREHVRGIYLYTYDGRYFSGNANFGFMNLNESLVEGSFIRSIVPKNLEFEFIPTHEPKQLTDGFPVFSFVRNIKDPETKKSIAIMLIDIDPKVFLRTSKSDYIRKETNIYITDKNKQIIFRSDKDENTGYLDNIYFDQLNKNKTGNYAINKNNENLLVSYNQNFFSNWAIFVETPIKTIEEKATTVRNLILIITICMLLVASSAAFIFSSHLATPLKQLTKHMENIEDKQFSSFPILNNNLEMNSLTKGFNKMIKRIKYLVENELQLKYLKTDAEFKALQAQINPHFLYNTLETISCIADREKVTEISSISIMLSNMFRYSIGYKNDLIPLSYEIEHSLNYLKIMQLRYENPIIINYEFDDEIKSFPILKLTFQPIIENAILHGYDQSKNNLTITINAKMEDGILYLHFIDNGKGFHIEQINQFNKMFKTIDYANLYNEWDEKSKQSIGLKNIHLRYATYFGSEYGINRIEDAPLGGSKISMIIPKKNSNGGRKNV